jgi:ElaB/YqjD/DUF883 family membrane-anchored ribosome-binding protein
MSNTNALREIVTVQEVLNESLDKLKNKIGEKAGQKLGNIRTLYKEGKIEKVLKMVEEYNTFDYKPILNTEKELENVTALYNKHIEQKPYVSIGSRIYFSAELVKIMKKTITDYNTVELGYDKTNGYIVFDFGANNFNSVNLFIDEDKSGIYLHNRAFVKQADEIIKNHKGYVEPQAKRYGVFLNYNDNKIIVPLVDYRINK